MTGALTMDHEVSIRTQAAEKYLLGELRQSDREEFEQHFFECPECAEEVRLGFQFAESAKTVFREEPPCNRPARAPTRQNRFAWLGFATLTPLAASLAMATLVCYQNVIQIPALRAHVEQLQTPRELASIMLAPSSRSAVPKISVPSAARFFQLSLATGAVARAESYKCDLRSDLGKSIATISIAKLDPDSNLTLLIPTAGLSNGSYEAVLVALTGGNSRELEHYRFSFLRE
jgi:anti-sigma factor RsiW